MQIFLTQSIFRVKFLATLIFFSALISCNQESSSKEGEEPAEEQETPETIETLKDRISEAGTLIVGFEPDAPPIYYEEDGKKMGFDYQLLEFIAEEVFDSNVTIETKEEGYDKLPDLLESNKINIMAGGRTDEQSENEIYSDSYLSFGFCILTKNSNAKKYSDLQSISSATIGVYDQYAAEWIKERTPKAKIIILGDREDENTPESDWMSALVKGEVDVIIYDYPFASNEIVDYKKKITITSKNINEGDLNEYVLVLNSKEEGVEDLVKEINRAIEKYKETADYSDAIAKYIPNTGSAIPISPVDAKNTYTVLRGETLSIIARNHLGDPMKWKEIYELNKSQLASPDIIYPGQLIIKPQGWQ